MKTILIFYFLLLVSVYSDAQTRITGGGAAARILPIKEGVTSYVNGRSGYMIEGVEIEGSPFFNEQWSKGIVSFKNGKVVDRVPLQLSVYDGQLYYNVNGVANIFLDSIASVKFLADDTLTGHNRVFEVIPVVLDKELFNTFVEVLADGHVRLLKFEKKIIESYQDMNRAMHQRFKTVDEYYLVVDGAPLKKIKLSKESLFKALGPYEKKAQKLLESATAKLKSESSFVEFINRINQESQPSSPKAF